MVRPDPVEVVVGLDAGTTSAKFVAADRDGRILATASSDTIPTLAPSPGASVQSAVDIRDALATACSRGLEQLADEARVVALAVAAQSGSVVPIHDGANHEAVTWMDTRSRALVDGWDQATVTSIRSQSGWMPSPGLGLSTISWLQTQTDSRSGIVHWASVDDYLVHGLTNSWTTNPSNAAGMQLLDAAELKWSDVLCDIAGVNPRLLSTIAPSGATAGAVSGEAAASTGFPESTPVIIGGHDQACAALGLDVITPGAAFLSMGTAWVLTIVTDRADIEALPAEYNLSPHVVSQRWTISQNLGGFGAALDSFIAGSHDDIAAIEADLETRSEKVDDHHFVPNIHQADRTGWGEFTGDPPSYADEIRSVMDTCAFEVRRAVEQASTISPMSQLTVVGGGTQSRYLTQQIADVTGVPLVVRPDASWPALGAAKLAAQGVGWPALAIAELPSATIEPRPQADGVSELRYLEYLRLTAGRKT
ncbi:MAG: FGGY family carbohydrate kinase [Acidimicrobiales bacterium]